MKYILSVTEDIPNYGFKARVDILKILKQNNYKEIYIKSMKDNSIKNLVFDLYRNKKSLSKFLNNMDNNSTVVIQYPWNSMTLNYAKKIKKYCKYKNSKSVIIVHDINSLRTNSKLGKIYFNKVVNEFKFINCFDKVICHNDSMKTLLIDKGVEKNKIISLYLFDYLSNINNSVNFSKYNFINIAGNLNHEKAGYVYKLDQLKNKNFKFNLYGINYDGINSKTINYKGNFDSDLLIKELNSGFGLVWDGESLDTCSGSYGTYLKINNPHKLSLYMAAGLPVIVWKDSAIAKFVINNKVGIGINSLLELDSLFSNLTEKEYCMYLKNVKKVQKKVLKGEYILDALDKERKINYERI